MSHNVYKEKFLSLRQPAWHRLGEVIEEQIGAVEALNRLGTYKVVKTPLHAEFSRPGDKSPQFIRGDKKALVADFGDHANFLAVCDNRYEILQPTDIANVWDMTTRTHVETMGILSEGKTLFMSTKLPSYDVKGDEVENYLLINSPAVPGTAATITITPVRVVCQNTLSYGLSVAKSQHRIIHTAGALNRFGGFVQEVWEASTVKAQAVKEAMEVLANARVQTSIRGNDNVEAYLEQVFPYPTLSSPAEFEAAKGRQDSKREEVRRLFEGGATGADTEAFKGTYFGLYNSVVEFVDYFSRMNKQSVAFGSGANLKQSAFELAFAASK